jgi:ribosomal protein L37E
MIDNLKNIREFGIRDFIKNEKERWACPECGEIICVHKENCISCGYKWR